MKVSTSGAAISTPSASPTHQVNQFGNSISRDSTPAAHSAEIATLGLTQQATSAPSRPNRRMSRGAFSTNGIETNRRTSAAPTPACSIAPTPMTSGSTRSASPLPPRKAPSPAFTANAPHSTPGRAARPYTSTAANAIPAAGYSGDAYPGGPASSSPTAPIRA